MKPKPLASLVVCSRCGLPWEAHTVEARKRAKRKDAEPTSDDCVTVLLAENERLKVKPLPQWKQIGGGQIGGAGYGGYPQNTCVTYGEFSGYGSIT